MIFTTNLQFAAVTQLGPNCPSYSQQQAEDEILQVDWQAYCASIEERFEETSDEFKAGASLRSALKTYLIVGKKRSIIRKQYYR